MKKIKFISVDFQNDFTARRGLCFEKRLSVNFVKETLVPWFRKNEIKTHEIISDYRQPRPGDSGDFCKPGEWGYESEIPSDVKESDIWIKCMNSPIWVRENIGNENKSPGLPYQDPKAFTSWLKKNIGTSKNVDEVIIFGLTVDCCVLSTAQELAWRGYKVRILAEAVDTYSGDEDEKSHLLLNPPLTNWAESISWKKLKEYIEN